MFVNHTKLEIKPPKCEVAAIGGHVASSLRSTSSSFKMCAQ